jgi:hypothetical protein
MVGGLLPAVASAGPAPALSPAVGTAQARGTAAALAARGELIYVANANSGPVTVYNAGSHGAVAPVRIVKGRNDSSSFWDPWTLTFDASGHLYVQTFLSDATTFVFPPGAREGTPPSRIFMANGPDNRGIAVDGRGFEYIAGGDGNTVIAVERPGAHGVSGNLYYVPPVRTIQLDESWNPWPSDLAVDTKNEVLAGVTRPQGNAIEIFTGGAHGKGTPIRVISGPDTGLGSCGRVCGLSIAFSPFTNRIYAAVSAGALTHISVFAANAAGNAKPVRTIEGPATGLSGKVVTGITDSQCGGTIYAMIHASSSGFDAGSINAYGRFAHGNAHPLRSFTDRHSRFSSAKGLAITNCAAR